MAASQADVAGLRIHSVTCGLEAHAQLLLRLCVVGTARLWECLNS